MLGWLSLRGDPTRQIKKTLGDMELPAFPAVVLKALQLLRSTSSSIDEIADQIAIDPGISVKVLSLANSATFALQHKVASVRHAVSLLGRSSVESMLLGLAVNRALGGLHFGPLKAAQFWTTSAERAFIARAIAKQTQPALAAECFTAALLQDLAVPLLCTKKGAPYHAVLSEWLTEGGCLATREDREFGWNHAHLGGWLCESWQLPDALADAVGAHHQVDAAIPRPVKLVANLGAGPPNAAEEMLVRDLEETGIAEAVSRQLLSDAREGAAEMAAVFTG